MFDIESKVLTPDAPHPTSPAHLANGKFAPGNALGGRAKRADERALLDALDAALPAHKLEEHMRLCEEWAIEYKSPKLLLALWQFKFAYLIGTPVQRSVSATGKLENILARVSSMSDEEFNVVEAELRNS